MSAASLVPSAVCPFGLKRDEITYYTSHYCEENIWRLAQHIDEEQRRQRGREYNVFVVFLSNDSQTVMLAGQRTAGAVTVWDYHVVLIATPHDTTAATDSLIYDFDSEMPFPIPASAYIQRTFRWPNNTRTAHLQPLFRVIAATDFLLHFASDRSHMIIPNSSPPSYTVVPPTHAPIRTVECTMNLDEYRIIRRNMIADAHVNSDDGSGVFGRVLDKTQFCQYFVRQQS